MNFFCPLRTHTGTALFTGRGCCGHREYMPGVDPDPYRALGYCFVEVVIRLPPFMGMNDVAAIVSIHGGLAFNPSGWSYCS
jgi:hypothetical protein